MNHQFQGTRQPIQGTIGPFYNPQKDAPNPNNPTLYQVPPPPVGPFMPNSSSKSYIARSNIIEGGKAGNNTSAYIKNQNDGQMPPNKFSSGTVTSPTSAYSNTNYGGFPPNYPNKTNSDMVKSSIHDPKVP